MADIKYNAARPETNLSGVNLGVETGGSKTLEQKLAGIMGTSSGEIRQLETTLHTQREEEEARRKAEEEARKRAEAQAAANAAARAEAERAANRKKLASMLGETGTAGGRKVGHKYTAVELGSEQAKQGVSLEKYTLEQARSDRKALEDVYNAFSGSLYVNEANPERLESLREDAQIRMNVASDAQNKNRAYIEDQEQKLNTLAHQIRAMQSSLSTASDDEIADYNEMIRKYNVELDLYNKAAKLSGTRQTQFSQKLAEYKAVENTIEWEARIAQENATRYSPETGEAMQADIAQLAAQLETLRQTANGYRRAQNAAQAGQVEEEAEAVERQLAQMRTEYAAWKGEAFGYDMEKTLSGLSTDDLRLVDQLLADTRDTGTASWEFGMRDVFGDSVRAEQALLAKYTPEQLEKIKEYRARQKRGEQAAARLQDIRKVTGESALAAAALSVGSVLSNFVSAPLSIADVTIQALTNPTMPPDFNRRGMAAMKLTTDIRTAVTEQIDSETGQMLYSTLMSGLDSVVASVLPGNLGGAFLGMTAASGTMQDVTERGGTLEQAILGGTAAGIFECFFESFSIGQLKAFDETAVASLKDFAQNILKSTIVNASEEAATELANVCFDILAMGSVSNYETGIRGLMAQGLTERQAKKAMAQTLAGQIWDSAVSGGLMGLMFGAGGSLLSFTNDAAGIRYTQAYLSALQLPEDQRPQFTYRDGETSLKQVNEYGRAVYTALQEYNQAREAEREANPEAAREAGAKAEELATVQTKTVARAEDVLAAEEAGRAAAQGASEMARERENAQDMSAQEETENVSPEQAQQESEAATTALEAERVSVPEDRDDTSEFAEEMAREVYESLSSMYEGQTLYEAVGDEANRLKIEGNADAAQALERIYEENRNGGNENGDGIGAWSERDVGESAGGEARTVAESAGRDQGRNIQAGRTEAGRAESENPEAGRKIKLSQFDIRNVDQNQTLTEITDTSTDPEVVEIGNIARRYGYEAHVVREQIRTKNGTLAGGVYKNGVIIVSVSDPTFSVTQLFNHELFHAIRKDTPEIIEAEMMLILNNMTDPEWDALLGAYQQLYAGLDMDDEDIFEEICADLYAGMMREQLAAARRANLPRLTEAARSIAYERSNVIPAEARSKNQTRAGPDADSAATGREEDETKTAAGRDAGDGRYSFAGVHAKNADREALRQAKQMKEDGADAAEILRETGWFVGGDGKWRFEIDDSTMSLRQMDVIPTFTRLGELIDAPMLFEAYPDLADMDITFENLDKGINGAYNRQFDDIALSYKLKSDETALLSALAHEVQHAIQARERFARGTTVEYWERRIRGGLDSRTAQQRREAEQVRREYEEIRENDPEFFEEVSALTASTPTVPRAEINWETLEAIGEDPIEWQEFDAKRDALEEKYGDMRVFDFMDLQYKLQQSAAQVGRSATDLYYDTAGEIEARNAARRRTLTAEERRQRMPDTGNEDTVFAEGDGELMRMNEMDLSDVSMATENESKSLDATDKRNLARYYNDLKAANGGTLASNKMVLVGKPSEILEKYLNSSNPIYIPQKIIKKVAKEKTEGGKHGLGMTVLEELPFQFADPLAITGNTSLHVSLNDKSIVVWTDWKTVNGDSVIVPIRIDANGNVGIYNNVNSVFDAYNEEYVSDLLRDGNILYTRNGKSIQELLTQRRQVPKWENSDAFELSISDSAPSVNPRFSISDDTTQRLQERADEIEQQIEKTRALMGEETDPATFGELEQLRTERTAIYSELDDRLRREARKAGRGEDGKRAAQLEQIRLVEDHAKELSREADAERAAYKTNGNADHLVNAERLRGEAAAERKKGAALRKEAGVDGAPKYRPIESMRQTSNRILDLFRIQAGSRAGMRAGLNTVLNRTLTQGYVTESDLESLLRTMYEAGVDVVPADTAYGDIAKTMRGKTLYVSEEVRREFGDDWQAMRKALFGVGIYTSSSMTENSTAIDSLYTELAEDYPGLFDSEQTDMRAMLEDMQEAAALGKVTHRSLAESAAEIGLSSEEDFAALYGEVVAELRSFADRAGLEMRMRGEAEQRQEQSLVKLRQHYTDVARRAAQRRQRSEQMTKIRNAIKRLNRAAERNSETLNKVISQQSPQLQQLARRAMDELDTVANRLTGKKRISLLELQQVYNDRKANDPNFIPNPATEKALARVGMVHLNDMSVEDLQALYDAVTRIEHDFNTANVLIGEAMDQQLDNSGMEIQEEIEYAKGSDASGDFAYWMNEASLSPSRALLRLVGYDRSSTMGRLVESFENGDIDAMGYTLRADMIFDAFMKRKDVREWLKTAAGENAGMVEIEVPKLLEWGEGDTPVFDEKDGHIITEKVYVSQMMLVQMARDLANEQNLWHVKYGGYSVPDAELYKKGNTKEAYARTNARAIRMSPEFVRKIVDENLDAIGKEYVKLLDQYYNEYSKNAVNRISQQLDGVDKAISDSYNPIRTDAAYRGKAYNVFDSTIEGMGSLKNRQHYAGNPMILDDADATYRWHRDNMARYVGYAVPIRNFKLLMNYMPAHRSETTRAMIERKFGANAGKFLDDFAKIVEEGKLPQSKGFDFLDKITGNYVARVLGFNLSSMMKQAAALATAATSYGPGAVAKGLVTLRKADVDLIRKYTPYYDYRGEGNTYVELANYVRNTDSAQQPKALQWLLGKNWLSEMDLLIHRRLWFAAEDIVRKRGMEPGTEVEIQSGRDPFYKAVAEVFNRMTHDTQTNYNLMSRPMVLRNQNPIVRLASMFKTDAFQLQGIVREQYGAWRTAKRKLEDGKIDRETYVRAKRKMVYGVSGLITTSLMSALLEALAKWVRGDDDDYRDENGKWTLGAAGKEAGKDFLYNMVGCVLFGDQVADLISAAITDETLWEPDIPSVSSLYDLYTSVVKLTEQIGELIGTAVTLRGQGDAAKEYWKNNADMLLGFVRKLLYQVGTFTGTPVQNMEKTVLGLLEHVFPKIGIEYADWFADFSKNDIAATQGEARKAALHAYLTDEVGELGEAAEAEILRLYELYGNKALPGANAPASVKELDEDGNEVERKPTLEELGKWDAEYRLTFINAMGEVLGGEVYEQLSDEEKLKLIARANEYARDLAKEAAGIPVDLKGWKLDAKKAYEAGTPLADAILFYTRASVLSSDYDADGNAITNSKARKILELLDDISLPDNQKRELLRGELSEKANESMDTLLAAGFTFDETVTILHDDFTKTRNADTLISYLENGFDAENARAMYEAVEQLTPEDGKKQVSEAQKLEAIAQSSVPNADKWKAFTGMFDEDEDKAHAKMDAVRAAGGTPEDYAQLRKIGQVDAYLRGIENELTPSASLRIVNAVAALPKLPEGESYGTSDRQLAAIKACQTPEEQIKAYATYGTSDDAKTNTAKFTAALAYDVTPELYLEARALAYASYNTDGNDSLKQDEVVAALNAMDLTKRQRAALWQLFGASWKKNPYGNTADIRDAYAAAKE